MQRVLLCFAGKDFLRHETTNQSTDMKIRIEYDSGEIREFESSVKINDDRRILIETTDPKHGGEIFVIKSKATKNITPAIPHYI